MDQSFNLVNPAPVPVKKAVSYIRAHGYPVRYISFGAWKSKLKQATASENALTLLACLFESGTDANPGVLRHFIGKDTIYDCTKQTYCSISLASAVLLWTKSFLVLT